MLVIARDCQPGDALMSLPTICELAKQYEKLYLAMTCEPVRAIADFPANVINVLDVEPEWRQHSMPVLMLGYAAAIGYRFWPGMMHPIHSLMSWAGLDLDPDVLPVPRIKIEAMDMPIYDVLLAPWARAPERTLNGTQSRELCDELHMLGLHVALVGGANDMQTMMDFPRAKSVTFGYWGKSFAEVANLMRAARCVVTADSFPGRLAHAAGIGDRHIILDSGATPPQTQTHPGAVMVRGWREGSARWNVPQIVEAVKGVLSEQFEASPEPASAD